MVRYLLGLVLSLFYFQYAVAEESSLSSIYLGSRESDLASLVESVSTIYGDYTEIEVDLTVSAPDSLILSRFYSSRDSLQTANFGGWRFNPHCFLSIQKDFKSEPYTNSEGNFEHAYVYVGNPDGTILTYSGWQNTTNSSKPVLFNIESEENVGLANTAKGNISCWTNLKNNELYFDPQSNSFELILCSQGKRFYSKHPILHVYVITHEILPSGNKIFYEFDEEGNLSSIKETNSSEKKVLAWIRIHYGNDIYIETSDGKTAHYQFQQDPSGVHLLTTVTRSDKPTLHYQYQVIDNHALLLRKTLPEGRFVQIDYYTEKVHQHKVQSITTPTVGREKASIEFSYSDHCTQVDGFSNRTSLYRFDDDFQLIAIEQYLDGSLYRAYKRSWGRKNDAGRLLSTSVEDANGNIFYYKQFKYDEKDKGNIIEEREYGDLAGTNATPLIIDEDGAVVNQQGHVKYFSYFSGKTTYGFFQKDAKGAGVKQWYKKGTNLLLKKFILTKGSPNREEEDSDSGIIKRHFYTYNQDAALTRVDIDDGMEESKKNTFGISERQTTLIFPKQELPNVGAPEVIEQKYGLEKSESLLKRTINQFDSKGNVVSQAVYDANGQHHYTISKGYANGLLIFETDPIGNETCYSYDANRNLVLEAHSNTGISIEYGYDLGNRLIYTAQQSKDGNRFETQTSYDSTGYKISEIDRFGNEIIYMNDDLGRPISVIYPEVSNKPNSSIKPTYTYAYDLFDNLVSVTDPKGRTLAKSYNVHGQPAVIHYLDETKEIFRYDSGGNLHQYHGRDGTVQRFEYDHLGRLSRLTYFERENKGPIGPIKEKNYDYDAFHKISETDEIGKTTKYAYDRAGRISSLTKDKRKIEFIYDSLGRMYGVKRWKSSKTFTLESKEYDLLDRVVEERIEDQTGKILVKKKYVYNSTGQLARVIGYPQNEESILMQYEYDSFGRLFKTINASGSVTTIAYDDAYINEWGQRTEKRTIFDPLGNQTEEIFNVDGNIIKVTKKDALSHLLFESELFYDVLGNQVLEKTGAVEQSKPLRTYEIDRSFNQKDQLEAITLGKRTSDGRTSRFEYNAYGELAAKYRPGSEEPIKYQYDEVGNLETLSYQSEGKEIEYKFFYDTHDNLTQVKLGSSFRIHDSFDAHDMPLSETVKDEFGSYQVSCIYDGEGNIQTLQLPDNSLIEYTYEGPFVKSAKRLRKGRKELYTYQVFLRDQMGNILEEILPGNAGQRTQSWDKAGRRTSIITDFFQDKVPEDGYDSLDNLKKRELVFDEETTRVDYDYNALSQLISEKGEIEHTYSYDSLGNRLKRNDSVYKVDEFNQLIEAEGALYTFDENGNIATKTIHGKTWVYQTNPLNQIVSITDPDQNIVKFTYDASGRRFTKRIEAKGKKTKIFRFFYLGDTEIGSMDEKGAIVELKIPGNPNKPETPCIALEIRKETYVPIYDLQGNIACLLDHEKRKIVETYRYSVYGEEEITSEKGEVISDSSVGNPWRYRGKRVDKETELICFSYRYYDPQVGRWISPDPLGSVDGPNLYAYAHNNPMTYIDYFGLATDINEGWQSCVCGYCTRGDGFCHCMGSDPTHDIHACVCLGIPCIHKRGGSIVQSGSTIGSALCGVGHGVVDFMAGSIHDLQTAAVYIGSAELEMSLQERVQLIEAVEQSQAGRMGAIEDWMMDMLSIDEADAVYESFRSSTTLGLEVGSLIAGGYNAVRGVMAFNRLVKMPVQVSRLESVIVKNVGKSNKIWTSTKKRTSVQNAFRHWKDHGSEFPELLNSKQYVEQSHNFFTSRDKLLTKIRPNGEIIVYDTEVNAFGVFTNEGVPKTMFKPTDGILYYERN